MYDDVIVTSDKYDNVILLNKHDLSTIKTIYTNKKWLRCSLMIGDYLYLGCSDRQLFRVHKQTYEIEYLDTGYI